jgi:hypothetical protein
MTLHNGVKTFDLDKRRQMQNHRQFNQRQNFNLRGTHAAPQPTILPTTFVTSDEPSKLVKSSATIRRQKKIPVKLSDPPSESTADKATSGYEDFIRMYA